MSTKHLALDFEEDIQDELYDLIAEAFNTALERKGINPKNVSWDSWKVTCEYEEIEQ